MVHGGKSAGCRSQLRNSSQVLKCASAVARNSAPCSSEWLDCSRTAKHRRWQKRYTRTGAGRRVQRCTARSVVRSTVWARAMSGGTLLRSRNEPASGKRLHVLSLQDWHTKHSRSRRHTFSDPAGCWSCGGLLSVHPTARHSVLQKKRHSSHTGRARQWKHIQWQKASSSRHPNESRRGST